MKQKLTVRNRSKGEGGYIINAYQFYLDKEPCLYYIKIRSFLQATIKKKRFQVEGDFSLKEKNQEKIQGWDQEFCEGKLHVGTFLHL